MQYIISPVTTFNEDEELFETRIGIDNKFMPLMYLAYGKLESISRQRAQALVSLLNKIQDELITANQ